MIYQKVTNKEKITDIAWENTERKKNRNENENPTILALLIGQDAILSFILFFVIGLITVSDAILTGNIHQV